MKTRLPLIQTLLLLGSFAAVISSAQAQPPSEPGRMPPPPMHGEGLHPGLPPHLQGLALSEAQQDQVFVLFNSAAPRLRELARTLHKSRDAQRKLALSEAFDEAGIKALASAAAAAEMELALLHARIDHQIFALLAPEQRRQLLAGMSQREGGCQPPRPAPGGPFGERNR